MVNSVYMNLPFIDAGQNQKEVTHGDGLTLIEKWLTTPLTKDFAAGNVTLTPTEWRENQHILATNSDVIGRALIFPASMRGTKLVTNDQATSSQALVLTKGTTTVNLPVGAGAAVFLDGTANGMFVVIGGVASGFSIANLVPTEPFFGARVHRSADSGNFTLGTPQKLHEIATTAGFGWDTVAYDTGFPETSTRRPNFWLGFKLNIDSVNDVDPATDQIIWTAHGKVTGMGPYTYRNGGGTSIGNLTDGTDFWLIRVDDNTVKLATSRANALAGTAHDITADGVGVAHRLDGSGRIMIPGGVNRVRLQMGLAANMDVNAGFMTMRWMKNQTTAGTTIGFVGGGGAAFASAADVDATQGGVLTSSVISVSAGDWFEGSALANQSVGTVNLLANSGFETWFGIQVVEYDGAPAEQIEFDFLGTPANGSTIFQKVFARKTIMNDEFANAQAYAKTAPAGTIVFDVQRNGVSIGSITFTSANVGTFTTTAGTYETFNAGDRLEVISPADLKGAADIMVNFWAWRSS